LPFEILQISNNADDQLIRLLTSNVIGTPGRSMLYQHADVAQKVGSICKPIFCNLNIRDKLYGTVTFCSRSIFNCGTEYTGYYIRYFTFIDQFRSNYNKTRKGKRSAIREEVALLMNGEGLPNKDNSIRYAYVDPENIRSKRLIEEFGFQQVGSFRTIPYAKFKPKAHLNVKILDLNQIRSFKNVLREYYREYQFVSFDNLTGKGDYFVLKHGEEILCGVQGIVDCWNIIELPGWAGKLMMNIIPHTPWIKRLFNPKFRFVFLEAIYCKPGHEHQLERLFDSVMAHSEVNSAILCLDPRSDIYASLANVNLGLTHRIMGEKEIEIFAKTSGPWQSSNHSPYFVSGYDVL